VSSHAPTDEQDGQLASESGRTQMDRVRKSSRPVCVLAAHLDRQKEDSQAQIHLDDDESVERISSAHLSARAVHAGSLATSASRGFSASHASPQTGRVTRSRELVPALFGPGSCIAAIANKLWCRLHPGADGVGEERASPRLRGPDSSAHPRMHVIHQGPRRARKGGLTASNADSSR